MVNKNVITMQNIILEFILFKGFSYRSKTNTFLLFYHIYLITVVLSCSSWAIEVTRIMLKENSVKPNIKAVRSGLFIS